MELTLTKDQASNLSMVAGNFTNIPINPIEKKNSKKEKKLRQRKKKALAESNEQETEENNLEDEACSTVQNPNNSLRDGDKNSASIRTNNNNGFGETALENDMKVDIQKFENTDNVLEMSASELSDFLNEIVENHIKLKKKINSD